MRHFVIVGVLVVVVTVVVSLLLSSIQLLPVAASAQAGPIDRLFDLHFKLIAFLFSLIVVFIVYSVVVFRRKPGETGDGDHFEGHYGLEVAWTILPLAVVIYFSYIGAETLAETRRTDPQALEVNVIGSQWSWRFEYPEWGFSDSELHLPVGRQVLLRLSSEDVLHSFWVPEFRVKQDALPGADLIKELRVTPTLIGAYKVRCAELCGRRHAYMENPVIVVSTADFDAWIREKTFVSDDPVVRGEKWARDFGCTACHSIDGTQIVGPTWLGLFGKQETLLDGSTATADEAYLRTSILEPNAQIPVGFAPNIMPLNFGERLTAEQVSDLIAYIQSLQ